MIKKSFLEKSFQSVNCAGKVVKSCWDDISEELYRANPDRRLFAKESVALMYLVQQSNEKRIKQMRKNNEEG